MADSEKKKEERYLCPHCGAYDWDGEMCCECSLLWYEEEDEGVDCIWVCSKCGRKDEYCTCVPF